MKLLDKVKSGAEQAAARARDEVQDLQAKRELAQVTAELGEQVFELVERGELTHPQLEPLVERMRKLKTELADEGALAGAAPEQPAPPPDVPV